MELAKPAIEVSKCRVPNESRNVGKEITEGCVKDQSIGQCPEGLEVYEGSEQENSGSHRYRARGALNDDQSVDLVRRKCFGGCRHREIRYSTGIEVRLRLAQVPYMARQEHPQFV